MLISFLPSRRESKATEQHRPLLCSQKVKNRQLTLLAGGRLSPESDHLQAPGSPPQVPPRAGGTWNVLGLRRGKNPSGSDIAGFFWSLIFKGRYAGGWGFVSGLGFFGVFFLGKILKLDFPIQTWQYN